MVIKRLRKICIKAVTKLIYFCICPDALSYVTLANPKSQQLTTKDVFLLLQHDCQSQLWALPLARLHSVTQEDKEATPLTPWPRIEEKAKWSPNSFGKLLSRVSCSLTLIFHWPKQAQTQPYGESPMLRKQSGLTVIDSPQWKLLNSMPTPPFCKIEAYNIVFSVKLYLW